MDMILYCFVDFFVVWAPLSVNWHGLDTALITKGQTSARGSSTINSCLLIAFCCPLLSRTRSSSTRPRRFVWFRASSSVSYEFGVQREVHIINDKVELFRPLIWYIIVFHGGIFVNPSPTSVQQAISVTDTHQQAAAQDDTCCSYLAQDIMHVCVYLVRGGQFEVLLTFYFIAECNQETPYFCWHTVVIIMIGPWCNFIVICPSSRGRDAWLVVCVGTSGLIRSIVVMDWLIESSEELATYICIRNRRFGTVGTLCLIWMLSTAVSKQTSVVCCVHRQKKNYWYFDKHISKPHLFLSIALKTYI